MDKQDTLVPCARQGEGGGMVLVNGRSRGHNYMHLTGSDRQRCIESYTAYTDRRAFEPGPYIWTLSKQAYTNRRKFDENILSSASNRIDLLSIFLANDVVRLAQLVNALTQVHVQSCSLEVQLHSRADSLTQASILPRSVRWVAALLIRCGCNIPGLALPLRV